MILFKKSYGDGSLVKTYSFEFKNLFKIHFESNNAIKGRDKIYKYDRVIFGFRVQSIDLDYARFPIVIKECHEVYRTYLKFLERVSPIKSEERYVKAHVVDVGNHKFVAYTDDMKYCVGSSRTIEASLYKLETLIKASQLPRNAKKLKNNKDFGFLDKVELKIED